MLSTLLKEKCQKLDLSSRQAAAEVGVSHATILRALRGDIVDLETLIKLSGWLNVKPATLLNTFAKSPDPLADQVAVVLERHPKVREMFSKVMKAITDEKADPDVIDDIVAFAAYKLRLS
jgi:transcriptional regulator with XRE-family HTH domain